MQKETVAFCVTDHRRIWTYFLSQFLSSFLLYSLIWHPWSRSSAISSSTSIISSLSFHLSSNAEYPSLAPRMFPATAAVESLSPLWLAAAMIPAEKSS